MATTRRAYGGVEDLGFVKITIDDGNPTLEAVAEARGYRKLSRFGTQWLEYTIGDLAPVELPAGFEIKTVAEEDDVERRRQAKALAFGGHYSPVDWPPAEAFREMQRAPDYRKDLDLFMVAPDGEYVAFCTIWLDEANGYGNFEPVGTHVEYQGQGLGRMLLMDGFRRMAERGIEKSYMDPGVGFYQRIGFEPMGNRYYPWIKYLNRP